MRVLDPPVRRFRSQAEIGKTSSRGNQNTGGADLLHLHGAASNAAFDGREALRELPVTADPPRLHVVLAPRRLVLPVSGVGHDDLVTEAA